MKTSARERGARLALERPQARRRVRGLTGALAAAVKRLGTSDDTPAHWWHTTPIPDPHTPAVIVLGPLANRLLGHAANILAPPPTALPLSPRVLDAVSALLATAYGYYAERHIDPDDIGWATTHGGALRIIEHPDGSVTFTRLATAVRHLPGDDHHASPQTVHTARILRHRMPSPRVNEAVRFPWQPHTRLEGEESPSPLPARTPNSPPHGPPVATRPAGRPLSSPDDQGFVGS